MTSDAAYRRWQAQASPGPALIGRALARLRQGQTVPVLCVVLAIIAIWYLAAIWMNGDLVRAANPAAAHMSSLEFIDATWSHERPLLPAPHQVLGELNKTVLDIPVTSRRSLVFHSWVTLESTVVGFLFGALLGIVLAVLIVHVTSLEKSLMPWIVASQTVPILAVAPIVIVVLGSVGLTGLVPKSIIAAYLCFFPVTIGMVKGLNAPDPMQLDVLRTVNASIAQTFWKLRWPASVPFLFTSLKVAVAVSVAGAIVGELPTGAQAGLGARLLAGSYYGQTIQIWAALFAAAALAASLVAIVGLFEKATLKVMGAQP
jgi:NitT/TauT family transport system permease protein